MTLDTREQIIKKLQHKITQMEMQYVGLEQAYYNSPAEIENKLLKEQVKRLREAIADIATNMQAADASYMSGFIDDLWKVIE